MRYKADITAGALKVAESRVIADLMLRGVDEAGWKKAIYDDNVLQTRSPMTAKRLRTLIRTRLEEMTQGLWRLVRDGSGDVATHACLAAAIKHSALLVDFLDLAVREQYGVFGEALSSRIWEQFLDGCRGRDPEMPVWCESTRKRLQSSVFQILAQAGYIENTKTKELQTVHIAAQVLAYICIPDKKGVSVHTYGSLLGIHVGHNTGARQGVHETNPTQNRIRPPPSPSRRSGDEGHD